MAVHHPGVRGGAPGDENADGARGRRGQWPLSAVCAVVAFAVLALVLLVANLAGVHLNGDGYDPATGGSIADWFAAIATLVAVPAAVLVGVRQLGSATAALDLGRRQLAAEEAERALRLGTEQALLADAVHLDVRVLTVVDAPDLATGDERAATDRWRDEYRQRGWEPTADGGAWERGPTRRDHAQQLDAEPSPLLAAPWIVVVECRNAGTSTLATVRWEAGVAGMPVPIPGPADLRPGEVARHRLGGDAGLRPAYPHRREAAAAAAAVTVVVDALVAGRAVRVRHPRRA